MSDIFFRDLGIQKPKYNIGINQGSHGEMTGRMLVEIEKILLNENPNAVIIFGDTNSTLAGALAASKLHIPIAHIEAGIRSFNKKMPEEINRIVADSVSEWLFVPTNNGYKNLLNEGFNKKKIFNFGDVMFDVSLKYSDKDKKQSLNQFLKNDYILVTLHRPENTDNKTKLLNIINALITVSSKYNIILPIHPRTKKAIMKLNMYEKLQQSISIINPVSYSDMLFLQKNSVVVVTDSGGIQKEAFFLKVPCVTLRDETEWVELVNSGWNRLTNNLDVSNIVDTIYDSIDSSGTDTNFYGCGNSALKIVNQIINDLRK